MSQTGPGGGEAAPLVPIQFQRRQLHVAAAGFAFLLFTGCDRETPARRLNAGGSTFVFPIMAKWADEYKKARGIEVNYQSIGSGGGIQRMTSREFDFACTDISMNEEQRRTAGGEVIHIPLVLGAIVPIYNLPEATEPLRFSGPLLADIFLGKVTRWNESALKELNPQVPLPDRKIVVVHRTDGSGTTNTWTEYLSKISPEWKRKVGAGMAVDWPTGIGAKG